jgi:hypothetical protein
MDGLSLYVLMIMGAIFSLAGLVLIFRKAKPDTGAAKIEFLGQKLEANSTGIVVFLIGAAFLAAPIFVPVKSIQIAGPATSATTEPKAQTPTAEEPSEPARAPDKPAQPPGAPTQATANAGTGEAENNDTFAKANAISNGVAAGGYLKMDDNDWFVIDVGNGIAKELNVTFKSLGQGCMDLRLYDDAESELDYASNCGNDVTKKTFSVPQGKIHLRVHGRGAWGNYTLTAASN